MNEGRIMYELSIEREFSAAHFIEHYDGPCANMHGHNYKVQIFLEGEKLDPKTTILLDFKDIKKILDELIDQLDHKVLNEVLDFNTSAEMMAYYFYAQVTARLDAPVRVTKATVWENEYCSASYFIPQQP